MTKVLPWVQALVEEVFDTQSKNWKIGDRVQHPDGRTVEITNGRFWGMYGVSNHWYWREVLPDGSLSKTEENGYGW